MELPLSFLKEAATPETYTLSRHAALPIADDAWGAVSADLAHAAGRGALGPGLLAAVGRVGSMLADALPAGPNRNELPNRVVLLD